MKSLVAQGPAFVIPASRPMRREILLPLFLLVLGVAALPLGLLWDFSWESTIGVDPFWAPPHAAMHIGAVLAGFAAFTLVASHRSCDDAISLWNLRAPFGAWLSLWSAILLLTATLFDHWWQGAYGLTSDVPPPPQLMSAAGSIGLLVGALTLVASRQNSGSDSGLFTRLLIVIGALLLVQVWVLNVTFSYPNQQHSADFYQRACAFYPVILLALARGGKSRWSATTTALVYFLIVCCFVWLLPLVPARPMASPVYNDLKTMMPPPFPLVLIAPALLMDLLVRRLRGWNDWLLSACAGVLFFAAVLAVQWPLASFLLTTTADNWFFAGGGRHWPFFVNLDASARTMFWDAAGDPLNLSAIFVATLYAVASARLGLWCGRWLTVLRR